ncbi:unnamed protein product [Ostreobium quekettii]|uniref:BHLH domain-containing protein n=1 Tax=Ostreobium quekettii TaxID=121088 RepID=A0A8S1IUT9_9CHLO|nr:unnamed protein product [Ostreobium quekettii]
MDKGELDLSVLDAGGRGYLDFLHDEVLALEGGSVSGGGSQAADADGAGGGVKRERDADESESEEGQEASASGKAGRPDGRAGRSKACREKARRERINERFQELAKLCDPEDPKTDKASILAEGIKIITQLKVEAGQLRQLNKFLEERVGNHEKEKGQSLYQQSLMLQGQFQQAMQPPQQPAMPCPLNTIPQGGYQVAIGLPASGVPCSMRSQVYDKCKQWWANRRWPANSAKLNWKPGSHASMPFLQQGVPLPLWCVHSVEQHSR